jgi:uncharacterized protein YndB with AHSA1/START domain
VDLNDAPADLVFAAITQPDLNKRWYGLPGGLDSCERDPRPGDVAANR